MRADGPAILPRPPDHRTAVIRWRAEGVTPFLAHGINEDGVLDVMRGAGEPKLPEPPPGITGVERRDWERAWYRDRVATRGIYHDDAGWPGLPKRNLLRCLIEAGEFVPYTVGLKFTDQRGTRVPEVLDITEEFLRFPTDQWVLDLRPGQRSGQRVSVARAKFPTWGFTATLRYDPDAVRPKVLREIVEVAGYRIGVGSFRRNPQTGDREQRAVFGRFRTVEWQVYSDAAAVAAAA